MKNLILFIAFLSIQLVCNAQTTTIFLVRHAEKITTDPNNKNPQLTEGGEKRALFLAKKLRKQRVSAIYTTDFERTKLTAKPLAEQQKITINSYDAKQLKSLASTILKENLGKKIVVVGHSNTVLETIEALGGKRPIPEITDQAYDYLFTVKVAPDGKVDVKVEHYGEKNSNAEGLQMMKSN
jgi:phosphohistidine phosphatase SixA